MTFFELTVFQQVALAAIAIALAATVVGIIRRHGRWREGFFWLVVLIGGAVAVVWPELTSRVAHRLGIGRGADLILYLMVVIMLVGFWMMYLRLRQLRWEVTRLVRHIALTDAEHALAEHRATTDRSAPDHQSPRPHSESPATDL